MGDATQRLVGAAALLALVAGWPFAARADWFCSPREESRQPITRLFSIHDENYFITGIPSDAKTSNDQVKFQISVKFDLVPNEGPCGLFFAFTQRSLWNIYAASAPFEDSNYNPQIFLAFGQKDVSAMRTFPTPGKFSFIWARLGAEHESNGQAGDASRSWNRIFASAQFLILWGAADALYLTLQPKVWLPFGLTGNPDLIDYVGYGELTTQVGWHQFFDNGRWHDVTLGAMVRKGTAGSYGTLQLTLSYRPPWRFTSFSFYSQAFLGYNETLLHYNQRTTVLRFGISLDDRFSWSTGTPAAVPPPPQSP